MRRRCCWITRGDCIPGSPRILIAPRTWRTISSFAPTWIARPVPSPVADLLGDLAAAFDALAMPWYVFGAQAAIVYGVARLTADVDVTVRAPAGVPTGTWLAVVEQHGFSRRFTDPAFIEQSRVVPLVHGATGLPVDVVLAGPGLEDEFLARAVYLSVDSVRVPVVEVSDLVILKVLAGRPKDLEDVVVLLRVQGPQVDGARVRHILRMLEEALGQSDLVAAFERALARHTR